MIILEKKGCFYLNLRLAVGGWRFVVDVIDGSMENMWVMVKSFFLFG